MNKGNDIMLKPEMIERVDSIIAKLDETDGMFIQGMVNEIKRLNKKVVEQEQRLVEYSWEHNPDRMGGQFTQQEIDEARRGGYGW